MCPTGTTLPPARKPVNLRSAFNVLDVDHDGKISHNDLKLSYANAGDEIIETMITVADMNKDGFVEYHEFENVLTSNKKGITRNHVMEDVFHDMDKDGDGKVGYGDLRIFMNKAGIEVDDEDIKAMVRLGCGDDDGENGVTFEGFLKILAV